MKGMKRVAAWMLSAALLLGIGTASVWADQTQPEAPVTVDTEKTKFDETTGTFDVYMTINPSAGQTVKVDIGEAVSYAANVYAQENGEQEYPVLPGDSNVFRVHITNQSGKEFEYSQGSFSLTTGLIPQDQDMMPFKGFDGQTLAKTHVASIPASNKAIYRELFGVSRDNQVTAEMMFGIYDYLEEKGYTGETALTEYMLDYYCDYYNQEFSSWAELKAAKPSLGDTFAQTGVNSIFTMTYEKMQQYCQEHPEVAPYVYYEAKTASPAAGDEVDVQIKWPEQELAAFSYDVFYEDFFSFAFGEEEAEQLEPNRNTVFTRTRGVGDYMDHSSALYAQTDAFFAGLENADSFLNGETMEFTMKWAVDGPGAGNGYMNYSFSYALAIGLQQKTGDLTVNKVDENGAAVDGAQFVVGKTTADGAVYLSNGQWVTDKAAASVFVSQNGSFVVADLPYGQYFLEEIAAPEGYEGAEGTIAFTVDRPEVSVTVVNTTLEEIPEESTPSTPPTSSGTEEIPDEDTPSGSPETGEGNNPIWIVMAVAFLSLCASAVVLSRKKETCAK